MWSNIGFGQAIYVLEMKICNLSGALKTPTHRDDSNKWSNIGFGQAIDVLEMKICNLSGALKTPTQSSREGA